MLARQTSWCIRELSHSLAIAKLSLAEAERGNIVTLSSGNPSSMSQGDGLGEIQDWKGVGVTLKKVTGW